MALLRTPRSSWIEAGLRAVAEGGTDAVRIEVLAQSLGVSKGGFYGQFSDRGELLTEMLNRWESTVLHDVVAEVEKAGGDARTKLWRLFAIASADLEDLLKIEMAVRDWARRDRDVAKRLRRVDEQRMEYMRTQFSAFCRDDGEVEARCLLTFTLFIGLHFVVIDHGRRTRPEVLELALRQLLT